MLKYYYYAELKFYYYTNIAYVFQWNLFFGSCFGRLGGAAIKLKNDLREKYGISVFAITQPTDTNSPSGDFQQDIQLIFSQYDNELRRQKVIAGMKAKFEKGEWVVMPP